MAGRARTNALRDELAKRTKDAFDIEDGDPTPTTLDYVCAHVENGGTLKDLALDLATTLKIPVDYASLMRYLRAQHGDTGTDDALSEARARASHQYAEESVSIVDAPMDTQFEVSRAQSRARSRQWLAEKWNRKQYGQDKGVSVSVSVGSLHLQALQHVSTLVTSTEQKQITPGEG